ncbi:hypothetical protein [Oceanicoccus sp. KOV_DT_Chl]|uniref:hypothetical protein n=1 Tax=Oceanicoccus sp. KOV_DT_Chl TaxID=1904639 RepID=UPI000C7AAEE7|nr:hypothetical protein [Oceanicoccus sp. KOV_DT_Chl]
MSKKNNNMVKNILIGIVIVSVLVGTGLILYFYLGDTKPKTFYVRDINDATYDCEDKIVNKYGDKLVSKHYDNLSSRFEEQKNQYLIYYRISIKEKENGLPMINDYMAKCVVWEKLGYVSDFRVYEFLKA